MNDALRAWTATLLACILTLVASSFLLAGIDAGIERDEIRVANPLPALERAVAQRSENAFCLFIVTELAAAGLIAFSGISVAHRKRPGVLFIIGLVAGVIIAGFVVISLLRGWLPSRVADLERALTIGLP